MRVLVAAVGLLALLTGQLAASQEPPRQHPYSVSIPIKERVQNAMNYPRLERNYCCCYCGNDGQDYSIIDSDGSLLTDLDADDAEAAETHRRERLAAKRATPPLAWYLTEELEQYCGFDHCQATHPTACTNADTVIYSGATGVGDYTVQTPTTKTEIQHRCEDVMREGAAWWEEFVGLTSNAMD